MKYYAMIDGEQRGPFELEELPSVGVRPSTYIWCKGMSDWEKAEENADVCRLFRNRLYDIMHPTPADEDSLSNDPYKIRNESETDKPKAYPSRFDYYLKDSDQKLPTLEEIDSKTDIKNPPVSMVGYAWLVTILCFFPTGIIALINAYRSKKEWKSGNPELSHDYCRSAKMWTGITFFIGLIAYSLLFTI